jgi:hypothetical protein
MVNQPNSDNTTPDLPEADILAKSGIQNGGVKWLN